MSEAPVRIEDHKFFDPISPAPPEEIFGIPTEPLLNFRYAAAQLWMETSSVRSFYAPGVYSGLRNLELGIRLFPLVERVQAGEQIAPEEVRPYRAEIKGAMPWLTMASGLTVVSSLALIGIPLRRALNSRIETEVIKRAPEAFEEVREKATEVIEQAEPHVDFLASFANPRSQYVSEISTLTFGLHQATLARVKRRHAVGGAVSAQDVGRAIGDLIGSVVEHGTMTSVAMPMLSHFALERLGNVPKIPDTEKIGLAAPEIIAALDAVLPPDQVRPNLLESVTIHPHPMRGVANMFKGSLLRSLGYDLPVVLKSTRDILPESGQEVRDSFDALKTFMRVD